MFAAISDDGKAVVLYLDGIKIGGGTHPQLPVTSGGAVIGGWGIPHNRSVLTWATLLVCMCDTRPPARPTDRQSVGRNRMNVDAVWLAILYIFGVGKRPTFEA